MPHPGYTSSVRGVIAEVINDVWVGLPDGDAGMPIEDIHDQVRIPHARLASTTSPIANTSWKYLLMQIRALPRSMIGISEGVRVVAA